MSGYYVDVQWGIFIPVFVLCLHVCLNIITSNLFYNKSYLLYLFVRSHLMLLVRDLEILPPPMLLCIPHLYRVILCFKLHALDTKGDGIIS
jgi:hypothetical protein